MSLLSRLAEKSWQTPGAQDFGEPEDYRPAATTVGLVAYLAVASVAFSLLVTAYVMRMGMAGAMEHGMVADWRPMPEPMLLWINTGILIASSAAWEAARRAPDELRRVRLASVTGGLLGLAFLFGQILLWRHYQAAGYFASANPANAFFYLLTGLHGVHLAGGLVAAARVLARLGDEGVSRHALRNVGLCALYWHFLLLVWIVLVGLLVST
ncbi:MAG TPA: cytochrome c oxidase subunit 3 [Novosphingobium sp.]